MNDPLRGTGRTTRMMLDAHFKCIEGDDVYIVFQTAAEAVGAFRAHIDTFACYGISKEKRRVLYANEKYVYFRHIMSDPVGLNGVVLFDHTVQEGWDNLSEMYRQRWLRVQP